MSNPIFPIERVREITQSAQMAHLSGKSEDACPYLTGYEHELWINEYRRAAFELECA